MNCLNPLSSRQSRLIFGLPSTFPDKNGPPGLNNQRKRLVVHRRNMALLAFTKPTMRQPLSQYVGVKFDVMWTGRTPTSSLPSRS